MSLKSHLASTLRHLLALLIAIAMVWQGLEAARGAFSNHADTQKSATAAPAMVLADQEACGDRCGDADRCDGAGHMRHHATATLHALPIMDVDQPAAERIVLDTGLMRSADSPRLLRPPKATPLAVV